MVEVNETTSFKSITLPVFVLFQYYVEGEPNYNNWHFCASFYTQCVPRKGNIVFVCLLVVGVGVVI